MAMVMSFTRIVGLSDRRFSSHLDAGTAGLGTLKPNWSTCNLASIILVIAFVKDRWKLGLINVTRTTFSAPQFPIPVNRFRQSQAHSTFLLDNCADKKLLRDLAYMGFCDL